MTDELGWLSFDVTDYIKNDLTNGYSWAAFSFTNDGYSSMTFSSGEDAANAPYLKVWDTTVVEQVSSCPPSAVPVPSSLGLAALGVLGWIRRRRA